MTGGMLVGIVIQLVLAFLIVGLVGWVIGLVFISDYPEQVGAYRDNDQSFTKERADAVSCLVALSCSGSGIVASSIRAISSGLNRVRNATIVDAPNGHLLQENLLENSIPDGFEHMGIDDYPAFLEQRRRLMAQKIRKYYESLK